jgi:protease-4
LLHHELKCLAASKPVVACLGDVAASGGYLVACGAHAILAQPTTLTGSIGVIAARVVIALLLERVGVSVEVVQRGARANMDSPAHRLDEGERGALQQQLDDTYQSFLEVVAAGRQRTVEQIEPLAGGRVYSGCDALSRGLVDQIGGFDAALAELRRRIGRGAQRLDPVLVSPRRRQLHAPALPSVLRTMATSFGLGPLAGAGALAAMNPREHVWLWCPLAASAPTDA